MVLMKFNYGKIILYTRPKSWVRQCLYYACRMSTQSEVRVRFAPTPTGQLSLGSLRTALFNYLFAKSNNGKFILRIEDTDKDRKMKKWAIEKMEDILRWTGLDPDEGPSSGGAYGPYIQSQRIELYKQQAEILLKTGYCYKCFCTSERLSLMRKKALQNGEVPGYDNKCRNLTQAEIEQNIEKGLPYTVRFKYEAIKAPWYDLVYGTMLEKQVGQVLEGDFIVMKADGYPTNHFANVVDDHFMKISHVFRGEEWSISTPKHLQMYEAFGWTPPKYAHLPLILNVNRTKMSKLSRAVSVEAFRAKGLEPGTVLNYVTDNVRGFTMDTDGLPLRDMVSLFSVDEIVKHTSRLPLKDLKGLNREHLKHRLNSTGKPGLLEEARVLLLKHFNGLLDRESAVLTDTSIEKVLRLYLVHNRILQLTELVDDMLKHCWIHPTSASPLIITEIHKRSPDPCKLFGAVINSLELLESFDENSITNLFSSYTTDNEISQKDFMYILRHVVTNTKIGPPIPDVMVLLGKQETLRRLKMYYNVIKSEQLD